MTRLFEFSRELIHMASGTRFGGSRSLPQAASRLRELWAPSLRRAQRRRRTIAELANLSDRMLADIGLTRAQIEEVATAAAERASGGTPRSAGSALKRFRAAMRRTHMRRATIRELEQLPDRILSDIGITRSQIPVEVERILAQQSTPEPVHVAGHTPVHALLRHVEAMVRPLRQWQVSRKAAGQIARLGPATLADLGYVKGDVDWVPEVMAKRRIANSDDRRAHAGAA